MPFNNNHNHNIFASGIYCMKTNFPFKNVEEECSSVDFTGFLTKEKLKVFVAQ
jgi:hypothetical protein